MRNKLSRAAIRLLSSLALAGAVASCAASRVDSSRITAGAAPWAVDFAHDPANLSIYAQGPNGFVFPAKWTARTGANADGSSFVILEPAK